MRVINVCLVAPLPPPYGGISHWSGLITNYIKQRNDVVLEVVDTAPRWRSIHDCSPVKRMVGGVLQMIGDLNSLLRVVKKRRPAAIHLTTSGNLALVRDVGVLLLSRILGIPLVYHIRFGRVPYLLKAVGWEGWLISRILLRAEVIIAIDEATGKAIRKSFPRADVKVVPNCVDYSSLPVASNNDLDRKIALFVGWVVPTKGIGELLSAWVRVNRNGWVLRIVGPADPDYLRELKRTYPLDNVEYLGELSHSDAMHEMAHCDLFVLPSYSEGFPNVVVEAMALGKAIVATKVGAIPEMLENGRCGVLVEARNQVALANAISSMLNDVSARKEFGKLAAVRAMENYSIDHIFNCYFNIWASLARRAVSN